MSEPTTSGAADRPLDIAAFVALDEKARLEVLRRGADPAVELRRLGDAAEALASTDPETSLDASAAVAAASASLGRDAELARARRGGVLALAYLGRLDAAVAAATDARRDAEVAGVGVEAARLRLAMMHPLLKLGRSEEAIAEGEAAAQALNESGETALAARADINLGNVKKAIGRAVDALVHLDRARATLGTEASLVATIDNTRGEALLDLDRFSEAREAFEQAHVHFVEGGRTFAAAIVEGNLADLAGRSGDLAEAFERFAAARSALGDRVDGHAARLAMEEGEVFEAVGLHDVALPRLRDARSRFEALGLAFESLRAGLAEAATLESLDRADEAIATLEALDDPLARIGHLGLRSRRDGALARLVGERARGGDGGRDRDEAEQIGRRAFGASAVAEIEGDSDLDRLRRLLDASRWHEALGRLEAAEEAAEAAVGVAQRLGLAIAIAEAGTRRAELARRRDDVDGAIEAAREAVAAVERTRDALGAERLRSAFSGRRLGAYEELVLALVARGGEDATAEAFEIAERARSRTLLERLGRRIVGADDGRDAISDDRDGGDPEVRRLLERLRGLHAKLSSQARDDERSFGEGTLRRELAETETALEKRLAIVAAARPRRLQGRDEIGRDEIGLDGGFLDRSAREAWRNALDADEAIVEYFEASGRWIAFVATRDRIGAIPLEVSTGGVHELLDRFAFRARRRLRSDGPMAKPRSVAVDSMLAELGSRLWSPVAEAVGPRPRVTLVPHGSLHGVPFAALIHHGMPLLRRHEISVVPSVAVWLRLRGMPSNATGRGRTLLVGVADEAAPAVGYEIAGIASAVAGSSPRILQDGAATADAVLAELANPEVGTAHLACHGRFLPEAPHASGLRLSDRWISVRDLAALPRTPEVVVLSGCETGGLSIRRGEEVFGLARTLLSKGTRSVIASLWPVSDRSTCELMVDFHRRWSTVEGSSPRSVSEALSEAQRSLARSSEHDHPAHWASFIAIGHAS